MTGGGFYLQPRDTRVEKILTSGRNNKPVPRGLPNACLKAMFESSKTYGLFTSYFSDELYHYAAFYYDTHVFGRARPMYAICGIARVLEDVQISQRNHSQYQDIKRFLEQDFCEIYDYAQILRKFKNFIIARIDVKLMSDKDDFQILSVSDSRANITRPAWFQSGGIGYVISSYVGRLKFIVKASVDGQVILSLLGKDIRRPEDKSQSIPYWIDYTALTVNGKTIFDKLTPAWHNKSYNYKINAKANEEITVEVEWLPHRSDT